MPKKPPIHRTPRIGRAHTADALRPSSRERGYDYQWERVRMVKLAANPLCEDCDAEGKVVAATEVHHIIPIAEGGEKYDLDNLRSQCHPHHMKAESRARRKGGSVA